MLPRNKNKKHNYLNVYSHKPHRNNNNEAKKVNLHHMTLNKKFTKSTSDYSSRKINRYVYPETKTMKYYTKRYLHKAHEILSETNVML